MLTLRAIVTVFRAVFTTRADLMVENLALRQQLNFLRRRVGRPRPGRRDRVFWLWMARCWDGWRHTLVVKPEAVVADLMTPATNPWRRPDRVHAYRERRADRSPAGMIGRVTKDRCCRLRCTRTVGAGVNRGVRLLSASAPVIVSRIRWPASKMFDVGWRSRTSSTGAAGKPATSSSKLR